jgi:peptide/nickel transport system permease protein
MLALIGRRLVQLIPTLFLVSVLIFLLQQLLPGDPATVMAGEENDPEVIAQIRARYRLDQPIPVQYFYWIAGVLQGDFGESMRLKAPVLDLILQKLPVTLQLATMAMVIALVIGVTAGVISAVKKDTAWDYAVNVVALWGISTPNFWLGIMLIYLFAVTLGWLPASGYVSPFEDWRQSLATTIMPAFVLGNSIAGVIMRHTRSAMLQALQSDYVRTARAKGLSERAVVLKHAMRNALTPVITLGALEFGTLLSGAVLTEQIFTIPGFGKLSSTRCSTGTMRWCRGSCSSRPPPTSSSISWPISATSWSIRGCADEHRHRPRAPPARSSSRDHREPGPARLAAPAPPQGSDARPCRDPPRGARGGAGALRRAARSDPAILVRGAQGAFRPALARHRRGRARHPLPHPVGRAGLPHGGRGLGRHRDRRRRAHRARGGLPRRDRGFRDQPDHGRDARLPLPHPRHRARGFLGAEPRATP